MPTRQLALALVLMGFPASAQAQNSKAEEPIDEIIVEGQRQGGDRAMDAFFRGDFETAEIEFERNYRIIKRGRTDIEFAARDSVTNQVNEIGLQSVSGGSQNSPGQIQSGFDATTVPNSLAPSSGAPGDEKVYSGRDLGFQLYMAGLSELQQSKVAEAKDSFKRALTLNRRLYDGRMRLGLIHLGEGDVEAARKQSRILDAMEADCEDLCERHEELRDAAAMLRRFVQRSG